VGDSVGSQPFIFEGSLLDLQFSMLIGGEGVPTKSQNMEFWAPNVNGQNDPGPNLSASD